VRERLDFLDLDCFPRFGLFLGSDGGVLQFWLVVSSSSSQAEIPFRDEFGSASLEASFILSCIGRLIQNYDRSYASVDLVRSAFKRWFHI
jgi:hypothetical protein